MVNGVLNIVAAVLFAVVSLNEGINIIWLSVAAIYLLAGIINLSAHALRVRKIEKAAKKAEQAIATKNEPKTDAVEAKTETTENTTIIGG